MTLRRSIRVAGAMLLVAIVAGMAGCPPKAQSDGPAAGATRGAGTRGAGTRGALDTPAGPGSGLGADWSSEWAPDWDAAVVAQAERLERLKRVYASGQVEMRWTDDDGSHFEFCRGELFVRLPDETALSLTKVGERFLWLGSDARRRWLFDLRSKTSVLWLVDLDAPAPRAPRGEAPLPVRRVSLVDLYGLTPLPPAEELDAVFDGAAGEVVGEYFGEGGPIRVTIDAATGLPRRVEALDDLGRPFLRGELEEYDSVERDGLPPGALPRFPTRATITVLEPDGEVAGGGARSSAGGGGVTRSEIKLFLTASPRGEDRIADRLFDLATLEKMLKPARTERR